MLSKNDYTLHVIRHIFGQKISPIIYGRDVSLLETFYSDEHSMGATLVYSDAPSIGNVSHCAFMNVDEPLYPDYFEKFDALFSFDYKYELIPPYCDRVSKHFQHLLCPKSCIFLVNPGTWSYCFDDYFERQLDKEREVKKFSLFKDEKVFVYENI